ncbi:MAG TPA: octanoyltransferase, partial [Thermoanaerobacter sp.]|nr:octanoyltransferase [Thermoanaerobacter sp.]
EKMVDKFSEVFEIQFREITLDRLAVIDSGKA